MARPCSAICRLTACFGALGEYVLSNIPTAVDAAGERTVADVGTTFVELRGGLLTATRVTALLNTGFGHDSSTARAAILTARRL